MLEKKERSKNVGERELKCQSGKGDLRMTLRTVLKDQKQIGESAEYFCVYTALSDIKQVCHA